MELSKVQQEAVDFYEGCCNVIASAGSGKALVNGTGVLTPTGYVSIEKLNIGDIVFGQDGKPCHVCGIYPQGEKEVYEVVFSDGNSIECCEDHLWFYQTANMRNQKKFDVKPLKEIMQIPLKISGGEYKKNNLFIPMSKPVEFSQKDKMLPLSPYTLGALLGDGHLRTFGKTSVFTSANLDMIARVSDELFELGFSLKHQNKYDYNIVSIFNINGHTGKFNEVIESLGLSNKRSDEKFIPSIYLYASINDRVQLLQGLIDTDGNCTGSAYDYYTTSSKLADDVTFLAESLGLTVTRRTKKTTYMYEGRKMNGIPSYDLRIKPSEVVSKIHWCNHREKQYKKPQSYARRAIIEINKLNNKKEMTCIKVDNADGSFLTEHCIVTHNTRVLVNRIVKLINDYDVEPTNILAITFSKKAKENMMKRLKEMIPEYSSRINVETFHSFGYRIIRKFNKDEFEILDQDWKKVKIIEEVIQHLFGEKEPDGQEIADVLSFISIQKNQMKKPNKATRYGKIYNQYEKYKSAHNQLDFDDMLVKCYEILSSNEKGLAYCQEQYRFILADEMQDTNAVQYEILRLIGSKYKNIFVVDDPLQNIFMWRGSDNKYVLGFDQDWPEAKIIHLNKNYRSSQDIVEAANLFARCIPESKHPHYVESISDKGKFEKPVYERYLNETAEADGIAAKIKEYLEAGYEYKDIAILTRTNAQLQNFEASLYRHSIPYSIVDGLSFIDRREIKTVLCYLRLICDMNDDEAFEYIYNRPNRWLGQAFIQEVRRLARREKISMYCAMFAVSKANWRYKNAVNNIYATIKTVGDEKYKTVADIIKNLRDYLNLDSYVSKDLCENDDSRVENLNTLERMASDYDDPKRFIAFMTRLSKEKKTNPNSVQLMTIHKSKGLEFPIVFVAGVNQGLLPHEKSENPDEEKRLMYVAMTRAEKLLNISSTMQYNGKEVDESEFISHIF